MLFQNIQRSSGKRASCVTCGLLNQCTHSRMKPYGSGKQGILFVTDAPTIRDDKYGNYWVGKEGVYLRKVLFSMDIDLEVDTWTVGALSCATEEPIKQAQIDACQNTLQTYIRELEPRIIVPMGLIALRALIGMKLESSIGEIHKWAGYIFPDYTYMSWVAPVFHPRVVLEQSKKSPQMETVWKLHLNKVLYHHTKLPSSLLDISINYVDGELGIRKALRQLLGVTEFAFDVETTGLKPHNTKIHQIGIISFAWEGGNFVIPGQLSDRNRALLKRVMEDVSIGKIAQNMKFEYQWLWYIYGIEVKGWVFDTMQGAHVLNNLPEVSGLKFQAIVNFGIYGYEAKIKPYLKSTTKGGNGVNKLMEALHNPMVKYEMMKYCALDSIITYELSKKQRNELSSNEA